MNKGAERLEFSRQMIGVPFSVVGILIEDHNGWPKMGGNKSSSCSKGEVFNHTLPNACNIGLVEGGL